MDEKIVIFVKLCSLLIETNVNKNNNNNTTQHNKKIGHFHYDDIWPTTTRIHFFFAFLF